MGKRAREWAWAQPIDSPTRKFVLVTLGDFADDDGICWPSQQTLAERCGMTVRGLRGVLAWLDGEGYIQRTHRPGNGSGRSSDLYTLCITGQPEQSASCSETNRQPVPVALPRQPERHAGQPERHAGQPERRSPKQEREPSIEQKKNHLLAPAHAHTPAHAHAHTPAHAHAHEDPQPSPRQAWPPNQAQKAEPQAAQASGFRSLRESLAGHGWPLGKILSGTFAITLNRWAAEGVEPEDVNQAVERARISLKGRLPNTPDYLKPIIAELLAAKKAPASVSAPQRDMRPRPRRDGLPCFEDGKVRTYSYSTPLEEIGFLEPEDVADIRREMAEHREQEVTHARHQ